jgi:hypothetical protein
MRLQLILPQVIPTDIHAPTPCRYKGCDGRHFQFHQAVEKPLRDTRYPEIEARRYRCLRCKRTFRVYPQGATGAQTPLRVEGLGVTRGLRFFVQDLLRQKRQKRSRC